MSDSYLLETKFPWDVFNSKCPTREVLDRIADKWTVMVIHRLSGGTMRFAELRRSVDGISQKVLTNTLRGLERDGLVSRRIYASVPPRVEYTLTDLGRSLCGLVAGICGWAEANIEQVQAARAIFDNATQSEDSGLCSNGRSPA
jgi:DNA-binding HxlR family transcriptional regulator